jgi:phosphoglycolate phosphatase-like HAD superfamily hydrolase
LLLDCLPAEAESKAESGSQIATRSLRSDSTARLLKNVNIFVDVDLILVDGSGKPIDGAAAGVRRLKEAGCHLYVWSTGGREYAESVARRLGIHECFGAFLPKPDIAIDDMPTSLRAFFDFVPGDPDEWDKMVETILDKHVD